MTSAIIAVSLMQGVTYENNGCLAMEFIQRYLDTHGLVFNRRQSIVYLTKNTLSNKEVPSLTNKASSFV